MLQYGFVPGGAVYMGIYLRCQDGRVSEHFLDQTKVCAVFYQMGGEAVPEGVWRDFLVYPGGHSLGFHKFEDGYPAERSASVIQEEDV